MLVSRHEINFFTMVLLFGDIHTVRNGGFFLRGTGRNWIEF